MERPRAIYLLFTKGPVGLPIHDQKGLGIMYEAMSLIALFMGIGALALGSELARRALAQGAALKAINSRLVKLELELAEQKLSDDASMKTVLTLERRAQEARAKEIRAKELEEQSRRVDQLLREVVLTDYDGKRQGAA